MEKLTVLQPSHLHTIWISYIGKAATSYWNSWTAMFSELSHIVTVMNVGRVWWLLLPAGQMKVLTESSLTANYPHSGIWTWITANLTLLGSLPMQWGIDYCQYNVVQSIIIIGPTKANNNCTSTTPWGQDVPHLYCIWLTDFDNELSSMA